MKYQGCASHSIYLVVQIWQHTTHCEVDKKICKPVAIQQLCPAVPTGSAFV